MNPEAIGATNGRRMLACLCRDNCGSFRYFKRKRLYAFGNPQTNASTINAEKSRITMYEHYQYI